MAIKEVTRMGNPVLRDKVELVSQEEITSGAIAELLVDMKETMAKESGIGIAAPQIGINKQVALIGIPKDNPRYPDQPEYELLTIINPIVTVLDETLQGFWEGCLSVPGLRGFVERPRKVQVNFLDETGKEQAIIAQEFIATVFQHEIDHLNGILYVDRIKDMTKFCYQEELDKYWSTQIEDDSIE